MRPWVTWGVSMGILAGGFWVLRWPPEPLLPWWRAAFGEGIKTWLPHLPLVPLALSALWGWHQQQTRVTLLALLLVGAHGAVTLPALLGRSQVALHLGLALFLPWAFPLLLHLPEGGMWTRHGWARVVGVVALASGAGVCAAGGAIRIPWPQALAWLPGRESTLSALLALSALWVLPAGEGRALRPSWSLALVSVTLGLSQTVSWWPGATRGAVWPAFLALAAIYLIGGLYGLTWRRAYLDELTGLPGRRAFDEALRRLGRRYAIAMVDVDHFKRFNDRYGHLVGDQVLRFMASRLKRISFGRAFRYGGEEFAVVMSGLTAAEAVPHLEGLRLSIEASRLTLRGKDRPLKRPRRSLHPLEGREQAGVTVSIGVAGRSRLHPSPEGVVQAADEALYRAKRRGRNCVEPERRRTRRAG